MSSSDDRANTEEEASTLTEAVRNARRGLKSDVARLLEELDEGRLLVALARSVPGIEVGKEADVEGEMQLSPHLMADEEGLGYLPVFTRRDALEALGAQLGWQTDSGPLEYCGLPGPLVLDMGVSIVDDEQVVGLVVDPMTESELLLRRHEIASLAQRRALPLVGYVSQIPRQEGEKTLVAELDEPIDPTVTATIQRVLEGLEDPPRWVLGRTFNEERDLEPHLTLNLLTDAEDLDFGDLAETLATELEGKLPPPGYIDILFNDDSIR